MEQKQLSTQSFPLGVTHSRLSLFLTPMRLIGLFVAINCWLWSIPAFAANVACRFKAEIEPVDVEVLVDGKEQWRDKIQKGETKTVTIPEGVFIVISKVYNSNLKANEDIRTEAHTRMCAQQAALSVPLFLPEH